MYVADELRELHRRAEIARLDSIQDRDTMIDTLWFIRKHGPALLAVLEELALCRAMLEREGNRNDELNRLREDAERYRWLRFQRENLLTCFAEHDFGMADYLVGFVREELDAAIDAARKEEK